MDANNTAVVGRASVARELGSPAALSLDLTPVSLLHLSASRLSLRFLNRSLARNTSQFVSCLT